MALNQRIGRSRHRLILLVLTAITLLTLDLRSFGPIGSAQRSVRDVLHPVTEIAGAVVSPFSDAWNAVFNYDDLESKNADLQRRIDELVGSSLEVEAERAAFERLLDTTGIEYLPDIPRVTAAVVRGAVGNFDADAITIGAGSKHGIAPGMAVVTNAGLVGRVERVDKTTSTIQLLGDSELIVGVRLSSTNEVGLGRSLPDDHTTFKIDQGLDWPDDGDEALLPAIGTVVVTAASSRYPAEIPLGRIRTVERADDELSMIVYVDLANDVSDLSYVTVMRAVGTDQVPLDVVTPSTLAPLTIPSDKAESES